MCENNKIAVIGLGYVGLPLAVRFSECGYTVVGYDINENRIRDLKAGLDTTDEINKDSLIRPNLDFTTDISDLTNISYYIITVPTPIDQNQQPDLSMIITASELVGSLLTGGEIVVYESTVYPGATEEICYPILEKNSGLSVNKDIFVGYSPERINPGDKVNRLENISKLVSGSCSATAERLENLYGSIINAEIIVCDSIKIAEAAKVLENTQRDVNIALINEFAFFCHSAKINTNKVINAAASKWNFFPFKPGLVGGHCIGVDPYYLVHRYKSLGSASKIISASREVNEQVAKHIVNVALRELTVRKANIGDLQVTVLGYTFKADCPDMRNTKVADIIRELEDLRIKPSLFDPYINDTDLKTFFDKIPKQDIIIIAVDHQEFKNTPFCLLKDKLKSQGVIFDVKSILANNNDDCILSL